jgi:carboxymethylenebutenolidase
VSMIEIKSGQGPAFPAYYIEGPARNAPAIVLIQEIFGVNPAMREAAKAWAAKGYHVVCPDLFWRERPGIELEPRKQEEFDQAIGLMQRLDQGLALADIDACRQWLAQSLGHDRIVTIGYCLGGRLAVQAAMELGFKCAVSYYGVGLDELLQRATPAIKPSLLHIAELDHFVPPAALGVISSIASRLPDVVVETYQGCDHAFARPGGAHFVADAAARAETASLRFISSHIG